MVIFVAVLLFMLAGLSFLLLSVWDQSIEGREDNEAYIPGFSSDSGGSGICDLGRG